MSYPATYVIAWAALMASINLLQTLALRGLITKADVDAFEASITGILENGPDGVSVVPSELSARIGESFLPMLAQIRSRAPDEISRPEP